MKQIEETVGYQIVQLCKTHRYHTEEALSKLGIHIGQEMILLQLWIKEGLTQSRIGERMQAEPSTITNMLHRLERSGFVERRQDPNDGRASLIYLTESGRALEQSVLQVWKEVEERTVSGLTIEEKLLLRRLLMHVYNNWE